MTATGTEQTMGDLLRDDALRRVLKHCPPADAWRQAAVRAIADHAASGQPFEAYDLVAHIGEPDHPSRWGPVFGLCARAGLIELAGSGPSSRPTVKSSLVRFWRGVS